MEIPARPSNGEPAPLHTVPEQERAPEVAPQRSVEISQRLAEIGERLNEFEPLSVSVFGMPKNGSELSPGSVFDVDRSNFVTQVGNDALLNRTNTMTGEGVLGVFDGEGNSANAQVSSGEVALAVEEYFAAVGIPRTTQEAEQQVQEALLHAGRTLPADRRTTTALITRIWRDHNGIAHATVAGIGDSNAYKKGHEGSLNVPDDKIQVQELDEHIVDARILKDGDIYVGDQEFAGQVDAAAVALKEAIRNARTPEDMASRLIQLKKTHAVIGDLNETPDFDDAIMDEFAEFVSARNAMTRSMEHADTIGAHNIDVTTVVLKPGELLALTSDGVSDPLRGDGVLKILDAADSASDASRRLVVGARNYKGHGAKVDDAVAIVCGLNAEEEPDVQALVAEQVRLTAELANLDRGLESAPVDESSSGAETIAAQDKVVADYFAELLSGQEIVGVDQELQGHLRDRLRNIERDYRRTELDRGLAAVGEGLGQSVANVVSSDDFVRRIQGSTRNATNILNEYGDVMAVLVDATNRRMSGDEMAQVDQRAKQLETDLMVVSGTLKGADLESMLKLYQNMDVELERARQEFAQQRQDAAQPATELDRLHLRQLFEQGGLTLDGLQREVAALYPERQELRSRIATTENILTFVGSSARILRAGLTPQIAQFEHEQTVMDNAKKYGSNGQLTESASRLAHQARTLAEVTGLISRFAALCGDLTRPPRQ